jgi:hypothetical protein
LSLIQQINHGYRERQFFYKHVSFRLQLAFGTPTTQIFIYSKSYNTQVSI